MSSPRGMDDLSSTLEVIFFAIFLVGAIVCVVYVRKNVIRYRAAIRTKRCSEEHDLGLDCEDWVVTKLDSWLCNHPSEVAYDLLRKFSQNRVKYQAPARIKTSILMLAKQSPELLDYCCDPNYEDVRGRLGDARATSSGNELKLLQVTV